jgi:hypothetical protein
MRPPSRNCRRGGSRFQAVVICYDPHDLQGFSLERVLTRAFLPMSGSPMRPLLISRLLGTRLVVSCLVVISLAAFAGCSGKKKVQGGLDRLPAGSPAAKRPKGPQTMGNLLLDSYIDDLKSPQADKKIRAAQELGMMGSDAKKALPALESLARDKNPQVSAAAKQAVTAIRKR